ncbi:MAG: ABC transporter ATP-binding protein [Actinomycetota bacterium]|nr:ABC transporter ATP-binding protein [Actinomycetota bacterium]
MTVSHVTGPVTGSPPTEHRTPRIAVKNVSRRFGDTVVIDGVDLDIHEGEFVVLLGPSGCGKSTLLRMIGGLQDVSGGSIEIEGAPAEGVGPAERDLAFVFQNYALYPHMTVRRNMSFPLLMRQFRWWHHVPVLGWWVRRRAERTPEIAGVVGRVAGILDITHLLGRLPVTLSGGQRQRVALGRAMVREPLAFLMDEPLSNLDAKLRAQTRSELTRFHRLLGATILYVTHDQVEAMTLGDKIGILEGGTLQQFGTPREVYDHPANTFVARFVGSPAMNILPATAQAGRWVVGSQSLRAPDAMAGLAERATAEDGGFLLGLRSEWVRVAGPDDGHDLRGTVTSVEDWGAEQLVNLALEPADDEQIVAADPLALDVRVPAAQQIDIGDVLDLEVEPDRARLFAARTGLALRTDEESADA